MRIDEQSKERFAAVQQQEQAILPSASNILGMSKYFSAMSKAKLRLSRGLS
jgi:hypothetical protein